VVDVVVEDVEVDVLDGWFDVVGVELGDV